MLIIEVFMRNIVATLIYSDNSYTMYSIITKDYVVQFNDEGYASSPLLLSAAVVRLFSLVKCRSDKEMKNRWVFDEQD